MPNRLQARRSFFKALLYSLALPALWLARGLYRSAQSLPEFARPVVVVPYVPEPGIRFFDRLIVVTTTEGVAVFSSLCPHLGCRIDRAEGGELVCPCHGSRFNQRGELVRHPAARGLQPLKYELDRKAAVLRVFVEAT